VWFLFHLAFSVRTADDAHDFAYMVLRHLPVLPDIYRQAILLVTARVLLSLHCLPPFRRLVPILCGLPIYGDAWPLDRFLYMVANNVKDIDEARILGPLATTVLRVFEERRLTLSLPTYRRLAGNQFTAAEIGKDLRIRKVGSPTEDELIQMLRYSLREGDRWNARKRRTLLHLKSGPLTGTPRPIVEYLNSLLDGQAVKEFEAERCAREITRLQPSAFSRSFSDSPSAWLGLLQALALRRRETSANTVLTWFWQPRKHGRNVVAYTILFRGLNARGAYELTVREFEAWTKGRPKLDRRALLAVIEAYVHAGNPLKALTLMKDALDHGPLSGLLHRSPVLPDGSLAAELVAIFVRHLLQRRFYQAVFAIWDHVHSAFGTTPNGDLLASTITAARVSTPPPQDHLPVVVLNALSEVGLLPTADVDPRNIEGSRADAYAAICASLEPGFKAARWRAAFARRRAAVLFEHHLFEEHPRLRAVRAPRLVPSDRWTPVGVARRILFHDRHTLQPQDVALDAPPRLRTPAGERSVISDASLRAYVHLLGPSRDQARVLAWMRELGKAEKKTVAFALVYFGQALRLEGGSGFTYGGEYEQLKDWVAEWETFPLGMREAGEEIKAMSGRERWRQRTGIVSWG
jgi:hypothetical protein